MELSQGSVDYVHLFFFMWILFPFLSDYGFSAVGSQASLAPTLTNPVCSAIDISGASCQQMGLFS